MQEGSNAGAVVGTKGCGLTSWCGRVYDADSGQKAGLYEVVGRNSGLRIEMLIDLIVVDTCLFR